MAYSLVITGLADDDTEQALLYYGSISVSLAERFYGELLDVYTKIRQSPQHYSFISADTSFVRDTRLASFPYVVVFEVVGDSVYVLSVLSTYRKPRKF